MAPRPVTSRPDGVLGVCAATHEAEYRKPQHHVLLVRPEVAEHLRRGPDALSADYAAAGEQLIHEAEAALSEGPFSVTEKTDDPPTGDRRDYLSLSIYYNPNPDTLDGLPYVQIDGLVNPEIERYDAPRLIRLSNTLHTLSLAYDLIGRAEFAHHGVRLVRHWFLSPATRMNPHMNFSQFIPGTTDVRGPAGYPPRLVEGRPGCAVWVSYGGLIEGCVLPGVLDSIGRLARSPAWSEQDQAGIHEWFSVFLDWMRSSPLGEDEKHARNNHGTWYLVQLVAYALATGRENLARQVLLNDVPQRLSQQLKPDGSQPEELVRKHPLGYVCFTLAAFCNLAIYGERVGVDLWRYTTPDGRSLASGVDWLIDHLRRYPEALEQQGNPEPLPLVWSILAAAADRLGRSDCVTALELPRRLPETHRYRLIHPLPPRCGE